MERDGNRLEAGGPLCIASASRRSASHRTEVPERDALHRISKPALGFTGWKPALRSASH